MSAQVRTIISPYILAAPDRLTGERQGLTAFLDFVRGHKELYRILDEAEFVDPSSWRMHYEDTVAGYVASLTAAAARGEVRADVSEIHAWAIIGMNVFLGLRYGVWKQGEAAEQVARIANALLTDGLNHSDAANGTSPGLEVRSANWNSSALQVSDTLAKESIIENGAHKYDTKVSDFFTLADAD